MKSNADIIKEGARETARKRFNDFFVSSIAEPVAYYPTPPRAQELYEYHTHAMGNWEVDVTGTTINYTTATTPTTTSELIDAATEELRRRRYPPITGYALVGDEGV